MTTFDAEQVRLGKKLGVVEDRRTFMAAAVLRPDEVTVPDRHRIAGGLRTVPVFANDRLGDCTQASIGHAIVTMERSSSQRELPLTDQDIIEAYQRVGGYVPGRPDTDNGAYELDSMNHWRQVGLGRERDQTAHRIAAFVRVDHTDPSEVLTAHYVFGGLKVCAGLPLSASDQMRQGLPWDVTTGPRAKWGSWGGHSMYSAAYDRDLRDRPSARSRLSGLDGVAVWTWGREQWMTWAWWASYVDETYAVVSEDYFRKGGRTPQGFDAERLADMLRRL
jgi:hypothetical protein